MGMAHIIYIHEDGLKRINGDETESAVGAAVMSVCLNNKFKFPIGSQRVRSEALIGYDNCVNWVAEVHSTEQEVFIWSGNCLRTLDQLDDINVEAAKKLFDEIYGARMKRHA